MMRSLTPSRVDRGRSNYLMKHWLGELPLAQSFWINYLFVNLAIYALYTWFENSPLYEDFDLLSVRLWLGLMALNLVVWVWQIVGLWRSARNHIITTNRFLWARSAQVIVVLGSMKVLALLPAATEMSKVALGLDEFNEYTITLTDENTQVRVEGYIAFGLTEALRKELDNAPLAWIIHLNSAGGYPAESGRLHDLIREKELTTYTETGCRSACTIAFLAGKERVLDEQAKLGFHQASFTGLLYSNKLKEVDEAAKRYFLSASINPDFIEKAFSTPGDEMWYPALDVLIEAGVVTHTFDGFEILDWR